MRGLFLLQRLGANEAALLDWVVRGAVHGTLCCRGPRCGGGPTWASPMLPPTSLGLTGALGRNSRIGHRVHARRGFGLPRRHGRARAGRSEAAVRNRWRVACWRVGLLKVPCTERRGTAASVVLGARVGVRVSFPVTRPGRSACNGAGSCGSVGSCTGYRSGFMLMVDGASLGKARHHGTV